jgi:hypothetical protein
MGLSISEKVMKLDKIASDFDLGGLPKTAQVLRLISVTLASTGNLGKEEELERFIRTYEHEYKEISFESPFNIECFDVVGEILVEALRPDKRNVRIEEALVQVHPILLSFEEGLQAIREIETTLRACCHTEKELFLIGCFLYMLTAEALYCDAMRLLYCLKKIGNGTEPLDFLKRIRRLDLYEIKNDNVMPKVLFAGWEDGHLRNAIAHASIAYDETSQKMTFRDNRANYEKELTLPGFQSYGRKLRQIPFLLAYCLKALMVRDIIRS